MKIYPYTAKRILRCNRTAKRMFYIHASLRFAVAQALYGILRYLWVYFAVNIAVVY